MKPKVTGNPLIAWRLSPKEFSALIALLCIFPATIGQAPDRVKQVNPGRDFFGPTVRREAEALLRQMTPEEKVGQLTESFVYAKATQGESDIDDRIVQGEIGSLVDVLDPAEINRFQHLAVEKSRMHIPLLFGMDVVHGYRIIFPVPLAMAASWDMAMIEHDQAIAAAEARRDGVDWTFAPMLDIARDPRWGRIVEGPGEDPYLASRIAIAEVRGFQGRGLNTDHMLACVKHFAGYGAAEGGRDHDATNLSESQLWNVYLRPFHAGVSAGAGCVMSAYMDLNDVPATGDTWLLTDVLRGDWGFSGVVVSDNNAVNDLVPHGFAKDREDAGARALSAGVDVQMSAEGDVRGLLAAVRDGRVSANQLDNAVGKVLEMKIKLGLFAHPYAGLQPPDPKLEATHLEAARVASERSAVLLRNAGHLLPLKEGLYRRIAVIGPLANTRQNTLGSWAFVQDMSKVTTILDGLQKRSTDSTVSYAEGVQIRRERPSPFDPLMKERPEPKWSHERVRREFDRAVALAAHSDLCIVVLGELQDMTGESASRASLALPGEQERLLEAVARLGKPIVLVLLNGRPLNITWASQHISAILEMWFPGSGGGDATAALLYGDANPGGKLPITWPRSAAQIPVYYSHNLTQDPQHQGERYWDTPSTPLYPFGYGLSYTSFSYGEARVESVQAHVGEPIRLQAIVENTGDVAGDSVVQIYIHQRYGSASRPARQLEGFDRVRVRPHERKVVYFTLTPDDLSFWSTAKRAWTQEPSTFDFWIGGDSTAPLHGEFTVLPRTTR
jgi:beta-glucosidase